MDPILMIVHYLFEKQAQNVKGNTIKEFFSNGTSFPSFIELILNENIPQIQIKPRNQKEKSNNNKLALQFLMEKNKDINRLKKYLDIEKDQSSLLLMILTKQCFQIDIPDIIRKCNNITYPLNIQFKNETELQCPKCIISLAKALSDIRFDIPESYINDFDQLPLICFKIPNFPLIIDESSFKLENINVFLIQILIIFEFYSDKIAKLPQIDFTKNPILRTSSLHVKVKDPLLRVINFIGGFDDKSNFDQINIIPNFVQTFFNDEKRSKRIFSDETDRKKFLNDLRTIVQSSKEEHQKINNIIKLLSKKEPIFNNLLFNFTNTKLKKSSTEMFFVKFLEYFFLKQTKKEMIDRCKKILFTQIQKEDALYRFYQLYKNDEKFDTKMLTKIETFLKLLSFANNGHAYLKSYQMAEDLFKKFNVPQIVIHDPTIVIKYYIPYYCQLQFIFDLIDERYIHCYIPEMIMEKIIVIRKIEVPKFDTLTANIIARNIALIQQNKIYKEIKEKSLIEKDSTDSISIEKPIKMPKPPLTFFERMKNKTIKMMQKFDSKNGSSIFMKPKSYWNKVDINYNYDKCVLYRQNDESNWDDSLKNQFNANNVNYFIDSVNANKKIMKFYCFKQNGFMEIYKLFRYNEIKKEWQKDEKSIKDLMKVVNNDHNKQGTTLVNFLDSYENDSISLCSQLIQNSYPNLDNDQIYVYAMRGKILSLLQYEVNCTKLTEQQEPIFLLLHVPEFKKNIQNIKSIVFQIYYFLSIISDINIVILNKEHYESQVELIERLYKIHNIYINNASNKAINLNDNLLMDTVSRSCNIFDCSSDGDEIFEEEEEEEEDTLDKMLFNKSDMKIYEYSINIVDSNILKRQSKFIVLIDNNYINGDITIKNYCPLAKDIIERLRDDENCSVDFISINKPITYRMFLTNFYKFVKNSKNDIEEIFNRFDFVQLTRLSNTFIRFISDIKWRSELDNLIQERLDQMEQTNINTLSYYELISNLNKELALTYPSIDSEYKLVCNSILTCIGNKKSTEYKDTITKELSKSSIESLSYLEKIINNKEYWSNKDKKKLAATHKKFLEDDFFSIIQMKCDKKNSFFVFEKNHHVLLDRIKIDTAKIYDFFKELENDVISKKERKIIDISRKKESGTNYFVRERENVREIKAFAEIGGQSDPEFQPDY